MCSFLLYSNVIQLHTHTHTHTHTYIFILFHILFHYGLSQAIKNTELYSKTLLLIHSIYNSLHLLMPNSHPLQSLFCWFFFFTSLWGREYLSSCTRFPISPATKSEVSWEGGSGWGIHVTPWLIHVNV